MSEEAGGYDIVWHGQTSGGRGGVGGSGTGTGEGSVGCRGNLDSTGGSPPKDSNDDGGNSTCTN